MCASKIGSTLGVGEGVGEGDGVGLDDGESSATVAVALGDGELTAGRAHAASNTSATSNMRAITFRVSRRLLYEMAIQWRGPVPESNYSVGRGGQGVELIVDHWTVVMFEGAIRRFKNPASILSAHYVIGSDGRVAQLVSEDDTAFHAGVFSVNQRSIGIEHEAGPAMPPTD